MLVVLVVGTRGFSRATDGERVGVVFDCFGRPWRRMLLRPVNKSST